MTDLIKRLRERPQRKEGERINHLWRRVVIERLEAANEIERQAARIEELEETLSMVFSLS